MKSCRRVPTARMTSASSAMALALSDPVTPMGADVHGVVPDQVGAARDGFDDGDPVRLGEGGKFLHGLGILHTAAGDDQRAFGRICRRVAASATSAGSGAARRMRWVRGRRRRWGSPRPSLAVLR